MTVTLMVCQFYYALKSFPTKQQRTRRILLCDKSFPRKQQRTRRTLLCDLRVAVGYAKLYS